MYKEILKTKEEFWNTPTILIKDLISKETVLKGLVEAVEESDEFGFYLKDNNYNSKIGVAHFVRDQIECALNAVVNIESDVDSWNTTFYSLIYWSFDMVNWLEITEYIVNLILKEATTD